MFSDAMEADTGGMLQVVVVLPSQTRGGAEIWQERILPADSPVDITVCAPAGGDALAAWVSRGVATLELSSGRRHHGLVRNAHLLGRHLRTHRPDVVVAHGVKAALLACASAACHGGRVVWVRHDDSFARLARLLDIVSDERVVVSPLLGGPASTVIPPPLAGVPLPRDEARAALAPEIVVEGRRNAVMASRLVPYKGIDTALEALAEAPEWTLHVFGVLDTAAPDEAQRLHEVATRLGVADRFFLHDARPDAWRLLAAFDALLMLTRADPDAHVTQESFGLAAYEASAAGIPVISTAVADPNLPYAFHDVRPRDPRAVASLLNTGPPATGRAEETPAGDGSCTTTPGAGLDRDPRTAFVEVLEDACRRPGAGAHERPTSPLSIVTTVMNDARATESLISELLAQMTPDDELIIVDGGSDDDTPDIIRTAASRHPNVVGLFLAAAGISAGRNAGIARAENPLIVCTDAGCRPASGWLDAFRRAHAARPEAGLLTGVYEVSRRRLSHAAFAAAGYPRVDELKHPTLASRLYTRVFGQGFAPHLPTGRSMAFTRDAWQEAGGFTNGLQTGEDVTFGMAVAERRDAVMVSDARVGWEQRHSVHQTLTMYYRYGQGSSRSGHPTLLLRDTLRLLAYLGGSIAWLRGTRGTRAALATAGATYLSLPVLRAARSPHHGAVLLPLTVAAVVARDVAKASGAISAVPDVARQRSQSLREGW